MFEAIDTPADRYYRGCMSELEKQADALQERQDSLRAELHSVLADAGAHLLEKPGQVAGANLAQIRQREQEVTAQIQEVAATRDRICEIDDRLLIVNEQTAGIEKEIHQLSEDIDPIYEKIGRIAFDVYRGNPLVDQEYADIFSPLVEVNSELSGLDAAMGDQLALLEDKPFLERMVIRGRIALLKNRRSTREGSFKRLVRGAGHDIMGTAFVDEIGDPKLTAAAEPHRDRLIGTRELEAELEAATEERHDLHKELESLGAGKRPQKRREELEGDLIIFTQTRTSIRAELATAARNAPGSELPAKCRQLFAAAEKIEQRITAVAAVSDRVHAALDIERLESDVERLNAEIRNREDRQSKLKNEIAALKREMKKIDSQLDEKRLARGAIDDLLVPELLNDL